MWPFSRKKKREKKQVASLSPVARTRAPEDDFSTSLLNPVNPLSPFSPLSPINWDVAREDERRQPSSGASESYSYTPNWDSSPSYSSGGSSSSGSSSDSSSSSYSSDSGGSSSSSSD